MERIFLCEDNDDDEEETEEKDNDSNDDISEGEKSDENVIVFLKFLKEQVQ